MNKITKFIAKKSTLIIIICVFMLGWLTNSLVFSVGALDMQNPFGFGSNPTDVSSPYDHISKDQIHVYSNNIVLDIQNAKWAEFTDTNSMDPILDKDANSIEITPQSEKDIHVGDIIVYKPSNFAGLVVHRVIEIDNDGKWFCKVKGDNLAEADPGKVRFSQIEGILVGIIY